jgi:hypothetical protein
VLPLSSVSTGHLLAAAAKPSSALAFLEEEPAPAVAGTKYTIVETRDFAGEHVQ